MARILSDIQSVKIGNLNRKLNTYKGWLSEGSDAVEGAIGICFNNDTGEAFFYDKNGNIITGMSTLCTTSVEQAKRMAKINAEIWRINHEY